MTLSFFLTWTLVKYLLLFHFPLISLSSRLSSYLSENKHLIMFLVFSGTHFSIKCKIFTFPHPCCVQSGQYSTVYSIIPSGMFFHFLYWQSATPSRTSPIGHLLCKLSQSPSDRATSYTLVSPSSLFYNMHLVVNC